jgi:hypothetical protein
LNPNDDEPTEPAIALSDHFRDLGRGASSPWSTPRANITEVDEDDTIDFEGAIESLTHTLSIELEEDPA